jgi:ubiquinone/menaquinone biosynthesis C-methylase UbiE
MKNVAVSKYLNVNYDAYYEDGDSEWRRLGALGKVENIQLLCSDTPQRTVIEIGAGEGSILKRLSEVGFGEKLWALEISQSGVDVIRAKQIPALVECSVFDGYQVPYDDGAFDIAILSHVVEHVEHPRLLLYEAARVARYVFVEVPVEDNVRLPMDYVFDSVGHINAYSPKSIRRQIQSCNLKVLRQITTSPAKNTYTFKKGIKGLVNFYVKEAFLKIWPRLATKIFTYHTALLCTREDPAAVLTPNPLPAASKFRASDAGGRITPSVPGRHVASCRPPTIGASR